MWRPAGTGRHLSVPYAAIVSRSELPGGLPADPVDAAYFVAWLDRVLADATARSDYRNARERELVLAYLIKARDQFERLASHRP